jgi:hypothetical protein
MPCGHFEEGRLCRCTAVRGLLVPSLYERERYCLSDNPNRCPTFRARALRDDALPEEVYYALWLPWAEGDDAPARLGLDEDAESDVPEEHSAIEPMCQGYTAG